MNHTLRTLLFFIASVLPVNLTAQCPGFGATINSITINPVRLTPGSKPSISASIKNTSLSTNGYGGAATYSIKVRITYPNGSYAENYTANTSFNYNQTLTISNPTTYSTSSYGTYTVTWYVYNIPDRVCTFDTKSSTFIIGAFPGISNTNPSSSSTGCINQSKSFSLTATDAEGNLRNVEWYKDGNYTGVSHFISGSSGSDSWSTSWTTTGAKTVEAIVYDQNDFATGYKWNVTVNSTPSAPSLSSPANDAIIQRNISKTFSWGSVSGETSYEIQFDSEAPSSTSSTSFSRSWTTGGSHTWKVRAVNACNAGSYSSPRNVIVNDPPTVSSTTPVSPCSFFINETKTFSLTANDVDGNLKVVEWYYDDGSGYAYTNEADQISGSSQSASYTRTFSTLGTKYLKAIVYDYYTADKTAEYVWTINISPVVYAFNLTVKNVNGAVKSGANVVVYNTTFPKVTLKTNASGIVSFTDLPNGTYDFEVYNTPVGLSSPVLNNEEFWGSGTFTINGGPYSTTFTRNRPYISTGAFFIPNPVISGQSTSANITVKNSSGFSESSYVAVWIDRSKTSTWDFTAGSSSSPSPVSSVGTTFPVSMAPSSAGTYYYYAIVYTYVNGKWLITDQYDWTSSFTAAAPITQVQWSGYTWNVKTGEGGPGPNKWMATGSNVWVDANGDLHMKILYNGTNWYCSEIYSQQSFGYGEYTFMVATNVENLDKNMVLGLFTYENDSREIDVEFSRWGTSTTPAGWYVVQPSTADSRLNFPLNLAGDYSTHKFQWSPSEIFFQSYHGHYPGLPAGDTPIKQWTYKGTQVPPAGAERLHINFWLNQGTPPSNGKEAEVVIRSVTFKKTANLKVQVQNINNTSVPYPGANGTVKLYNSQNALVGEKQTDQDGIAFFNGLPAGAGYSYSVYHNPVNPSTVFGQEYWGTQTGITLTESQTLTSTFKRNQPYGGELKVFDGTTDVTGQYVAAGTPLTLKFTLQNPGTMPVSAKGNVILDINKTSPWDLNLWGSSFQSIPASSSIVQEIPFTPTVTGDYYEVAGVQVQNGGQNLYSDGWKWQNEPLFRVATILTSKILDVPYYSQGSTNWCYPASMAMVLNYWGIGKYPKGIAAENNLPINIGLTSIEASNYLQNVLNLKIFYEVKTVRNIFPNLTILSYLKNLVKANISASKPIIMGSSQIGHAFVVTGYDENNIYLNDPSGICLSALGKMNLQAGYFENELSNFKLTWQEFNDLISGSFFGNLIDLGIIIIDDPKLSRNTSLSTIQIPFTNLNLKKYCYRGGGFTYPHFTLTHMEGNSSNYLSYMMTGEEPYSGYAYMSSNNIYGRDNDNLPDNIFQNATDLDSMQLSLLAANPCNTVFKGHIIVNLINSSASESYIIKDFNVDIAAKATNVYIPVCGRNVNDPTAQRTYTMSNTESIQSNGLDDDKDGLIDENLNPDHLPLGNYPAGRYKLIVNLINRNTNIIESNDQVYLNIDQKKVIVAPTVITGNTAASSTTTATSGGNITSDGNSIIISRGVCWSTSPNPTTDNSKTSDGTGTGTFTSNIPGLSAGTQYHVRAYAVNSAGTGYGEDIVFTTVHSAPVAGTITQPTCTVPGGSVVLSGLPADGSWTINPGNITGTGPTKTITDLMPGSYNFTVTNASGLPSAATSNIVITANVSAPNAPEVGTITQPTCTVATGSVVLNGLPSAGTWTLNPGNITGTGTSKTISGLASGTYTYSVTNASGCISLPSANVVINPQPIPTAPIIGTITHPTCISSAGSVVLDGLPSEGTWIINPGNISGTGISKTIDGLASGTYSFTVTNASGCSSGASNNFIINPQPVVPSSPVIGTITQPTCAVATGSVALSGLPSDAAWTINPGNISGSGASYSITNLSPGSFNFTVTNASGCASAPGSTVVITANATSPSAPVRGVITQPTCSSATGSIVLDGLPATGTWTINPGNITGTGTSKTIPGLTAGTYTYTVTNASGCISLASAGAVINPQPIPSTPVAGPVTHPTCISSTGSIVLNGLPAEGTWIINPGNISGTGTSRTIEGLASGTYSYTVTNASGCISGVSNNIIIDPQPVVPSSPVIGTVTQPTCAVATGSVALSGLPSDGDWTINPGNISGSGASYSITDLSPGSYTFTVTNASGCISTPGSTVVLTANSSTPAAPVISSVVQPTCSSVTGSIVLDGLPSSGTWTINPGNIMGTGTGKTVSGLAAGTYAYTVTNASGCISLASSGAVIKAQSIPSIPVAGPVTHPTCISSTGSIVLNGLPAEGTWIINPGNISGTGTSRKIEGLIPGTYSYTVTNAAGCISGASDNFVVNSQPLTPAAPVIENITQPTFIVLTGSVVLSGLPVNGSWTINPGKVSGSGNTAEIPNLTPGNYRFTVTNLAGCSSAESEPVLIVSATGLEDEIFSGLKLYPNPAKNIINLELGDYNYEKLRIIIMNTQGKVIAVKDYRNLNESDIIKIDTQNLPYGLYHIKIINSTHSTILSFIKL